MKTSKNNENTPKTLRKAKINLLDTIENIVERLESVKDGDRTNVCSQTKKLLQKLSKEFDITINQALLLTTLVNFYDDSHICNRDILKFLRCKNLKLLRMAEDFETLRVRGLIRVKHGERRRGFQGRKHDSDDTSYSVPKEVVASLKNNEIYEYIPVQIDDLKEWFDAVCNLMSEKQFEYISIAALHTETLNMLTDYPQLKFAKKLKKLKLSKLDTLLLVYIAHEYVCHDHDNVKYNDIEEFFEPPEKRHVKDFFKNKYTTLFARNLIEFVAEEAVGKAKGVRLTNAAKEDLLMELDLKVTPKKDFIITDNIIEKAMFYNEKEKKQVEELQKLLSQEHFNTVLERMKDKGLSQGFSCLFYGSPGTGKTETVLQLAKQTGRNIFMVDISSTKSMWFGESEKKIKEVFNKYRSSLTQHDKAPILLFNEADAVFGKRKNVSSSNVAQTENAIQNIILQEMETLKGILIATTRIVFNA